MECGRPMLLLHRWSFYQILFARQFGWLWLVLWDFLEPILCMHSLGFACRMRISLSVQRQEPVDIA